MTGSSIKGWLVENAIRLLPASTRRKLAVSLVSECSHDDVADVALGSIARLAEHPDPEAALKQGLDLDMRLYGYLGQIAVRYGEGRHPKTELIDYFAFFGTNVIGNRVLDIGCANGDMAMFVQEMSGARVTGVDINPTAIERANAKASSDKLSFIVGDICTAVPEGGFDTVMMSNVLEHLDQRVQTLQRIRSETGLQRLLVRVPSRERDWRVPLRQKLDVPWMLDATHYIEYIYEELKDELQTAGFSVSSAVSKWGEYWVVAVPSEEAHEEPDEARR